MTLQELCKKLESLNLPLIYQDFPKRQAPPYIAYFEDDSDSITADGVVVVLVQKVEIHLITKHRDFALESALEALLYDSELVWERSNAYDSTQEILDTIYELELIN